MSRRSFPIGIKLWTRPWLLGPGSLANCNFCNTEDMLALQMAMPAEDWTCDDSSRIRSKVQRCMQVHFHNLSFLVKNLQLTRGQALTSCLSCTARDLAPSPSELWSCRASWTSTWPSLHMRAKILPSLGHLITTTTLCGRNSYNEQGMPGHLANFQPSNNQVPNHAPVFFQEGFLH